MSQQAVARRYAEALFELALEKGLLDQVEKDLAQVTGLLKEDLDLRSIFLNQLLPGNQKMEIFSQLLGPEYQEITRNFIFLLLEKRREEHLFAIYREYVNLADQERNIMDGEVWTAAELSDQIKKDLEKRLSKLSGKNVRLQYKVDPKLLGGAVLKIGDKVLNGSLANRLEKMKENLML